MASSADHPNRVATGPRDEWPLLVVLATAGVFLTFSERLLENLSQPVWFAVVSLWLFGVILLAAMSIVRHAENLAVILGEPLGTLVLTLAVISIEVLIISASMATSQGSSALARDAMFAVVMIVLNGMVGLSLLLGGLRHHEQSYNLQGASAYLTMIISLSVLGLVLPNFTAATPGPTFSRLQAALLSVMSIGLYVVFLAVQTSVHRHYFLPPNEGPGEPREEEHGGHGDLVPRSTFYHSALLVIYLLPLVVLSKKLAVPIDYGIRVFGGPPALGGFIVAALVLSPESVSALRAALSNQLQRSVNLLLGSVVASIGLTIPAVLTIGLVTGRSVVLGLEPSSTVLLLLTLVVSLVTFSSNRTNVLLGAVHLLLFVAYVMLIFDR